MVLLAAVKWGNTSHGYFISADNVQILCRPYHVMDCGFYDLQISQHHTFLCVI